MEIFDKIGQKASEAYKVTADKTSKIARDAKLKMKMNDLKSQISVKYKEIGSKVYEKHTLNETIDIKADLEEECKRIDELSEEIEKYLAESLELRDKRKCQKCFKEIDLDVNFCPHCGAEQEKVEINVEESNNTEGDIESKPEIIDAEVIEEETKQENTEYDEDEN